MKITEYDFNVLTQKTTETERERNAQEIAERETFELQIAAEQAEAEAKTIARQAILSRLGLTAEEAQLLLS